jgi:hypothetical protein
MKSVSQCRALIVSVAAILAMFFFVSCTSTQPLPRYLQTPVPLQSEHASLFPDGWQDLTDRKTIPSVQLFLVNKDFSAAIVLREFQMDDSTKKILFLEDICTAARISLQLKIDEFPGERRVTKVPEYLSDSACSYVYDEKGLLRRVIVYRNTIRFFELELRQEQASVSFEPLTKDLFEVMKVLMRN